MNGVRRKVQEKGSFAFKMVLKILEVRKIRGAKLEQSGSNRSLQPDVAMAG